jgi:hypothetical protein
MRKAKDAKRLAELVASLRDRPARERIAALRGLAGRTPRLALPISELLLKELAGSSSHRAEAAQALAELGAPYRDRGYAELSRLMAHRPPDTAPDMLLHGGDPDGASQQLHTAQAIAALGAPCQREAAAALRIVISGYRNAIRVRAAESLGALGEEWRVEAAEVLRAFIRRPEDGYHGGTGLELEAALAIGAWGEPYREEMISALRRLAADRTFYNHRTQAAEALVEADRAQRAWAIEALEDAVAARGYPEASRIRSAARSLLRLDPGAAPRVAEIVRSTLAAPDYTHRVHQHAALTLTDLGPGYAPEAAAALKRLLAQGDAYPDDHRAEMANALDGLRGEPLLETVAVLVELILDPHEDWTVDWACEEILSLSPEARADAVRRLQSVVDGSVHAAAARVHAGDALDTLADWGAHG